MKIHFFSFKKNTEFLISELTMSRSCQHVSGMKTCGKPSKRKLNSKWYCLSHYKTQVNNEKVISFDAKVEDKLAVGKMKFIEKSRKTSDLNRGYIEKYEIRSKSIIRSMKSIESMF